MHFRVQIKSKARPPTTIQTTTGTENRPANLCLHFGFCTFRWNWNRSNLAGQHQGSLEILAAPTSADNILEYHACNNNNNNNNNNKNKTDGILTQLQHQLFGANLRFEKYRDNW
jgi:hypothetical protein